MTVVQTTRLWSHCACSTVHLPQCEDVRMRQFDTVMATVPVCVFHQVRMLELNESVLQYVLHTVKMLERAGSTR